MSAATNEDADVPLLAVKGLDEATRKARLTGEILVVREWNLLKITQQATVEVVRGAQRRLKVKSRVKKIKQ